MAWCLIQSKANEFIKALQSGELDPLKMADMTSEARHELLSKYVGVDNATNVNSLYESKLLLKNQTEGMKSWIRRTVGINTPVGRDLLSQVSKMDKVLNPADETRFLKDLAQTRLKLNITADEAKNIFDLSKTSQDLKTKANDNGIFPTKEDRLNYGVAQVNFEKYANQLKLETRSYGLSIAKKVFNLIKESPGTLKSIAYSLDNSFFGRQGIKTLYTHPTVWVKSFLKSWPDIVKQALKIGGEDGVMDSIKADIYSRPNALTGKYRAGGYGLDALSEEAYPSSLPEKIPLFGRLFKASEVAYNGAALRMRADLADMMISKMEKMGINTLDPKEAKGAGYVIGSLTGRGNLPLTPGQSKFANVMFASVKFIKGNFDTLTAHQFDSRVSSFAKREAALNLVKIIATEATILTVAKIIDPNSVQQDPRSTNFGKIKLFGHWTDISGGMAGLLTLASKITPTYHNGELGFWSVDKNGSYINEGTKYGTSTPLDVINSFFEGKLSPVAGFIRDQWTRQTYQGKTPTLQNELPNIFPMTIGNYSQLKNDPQSSSILGSMILDALGLSVNINNFQKDWNQNPTKPLQQFKQKVGDSRFQQANTDFNMQYNNWYNKVISNSNFKNLSATDKQNVITAKKTDLQSQVFKSYGFEYKNSKTKANTQQHKAMIKNLIR